MKMPSENRFSREIEMILLCANISMGEADVERIRYLGTQPVDWNYIKKTLFLNRVNLIAYRNFKTVEENLPLDFISGLKALAVSTGRRNFFFSVYLQRILSDFAQHDIFVMPFKGPALGEQVYKDGLLRHFSDLDILVDQSDVIPAFHLLINKGLSPQFALNDDQLAKYITDEDHFSFYDNREKMVVELHWDLSGLYLSRQVTVADLKNIITTGSLNCQTIPCLTSEALLVYLCVHGAKHGWEYLEQVCSVSELLKTTPELDWGKVGQLSSDWRCKRMLSLGLYLAFTLLKAPVPDSWYSRILQDEPILEMAQEITDNLFDSGPDENRRNLSDRFSSFHIKIRDSFTDKIRYFFRLLFRPTDKEWQFFPVAPPFAFVHHVLRPIRLVFCKFKGDHA